MLGSRDRQRVRPTLKQVNEKKGAPGGAGVVSITENKELRGGKIL